MWAKHQFVYDRQDLNLNLINFKVIELDKRLNNKIYLNNFRIGGQSTGLCMAGKI